MDNTNTTTTEQQTVETQKPKTGAERQADILISALQRAKDNGGILVNANQKTQPNFYQNGVKVTMSPFNSLILAMHSDEHGYQTNQMTLFSDAKNRGESVRKSENGVPFSWYAWNEYINKSNPEDKISRSDYKALSPEEQSQYKGVKTNEFRILFNIDQTTLSSVHKEDYDKAVKEHGGIEQRDFTPQDDKNLRITVNEYILRLRDNLVPIRKDGSGVASYDKQKDAVHIPAQNAYGSYAEYVQDITRNVVAATAHPQRLNRHSSQNYATLVTELASANKQLQYAMPAKLSPKAMEQLDNIIDSLQKNPKLVTSIEHDVNASMGMIQKAAAGEKIEKRPTPKEMDNWRSRLPKEETVPDKFDAVLMLRDNNEKWSLYVKPENEPAFAVHPRQNDVTMFFNVIRNNVTEKTETFRQELAQKYYAEVAQHPEKAVDIFKSDATEADLARIEKINIFKTKDEPSKILAVPVIDGERQKAREVTQDQWQRMWLAPDMKEYKKHLAAVMYADVLKGKSKDNTQSQGQTQNQNQQQNQEQKNEQKEPVTLDIPKWSLNYIVNGDAEGLTDEEKDIVDKFLDEHFADGFVPEVIEGNDKDFNVSPAFGTRNPNALPNKGESPYQAVETSEVKFYPSGYFERRDESQSEGVEEGEVVVDNRKEQTFDPEDNEEDKECTRLLEQIAKLEKKCRTETQPNRQRAMFLEIKDLKSQLDARVKMLQEQARQEELAKQKQNSPEQKEKERREEKVKEEATKQETKAIAKVALSPMLKQFLDLKKKHPDALLLFRCGDFYETYQKDAEKASKILGITLTRSSKTKDQDGKPLAMAGFPYHALDTYLPKLIRAGERVAICDQIEAPKQTTKRGISEMVSPGIGKQQEQKQEEQLSAKAAPKAEQEENRSRGFHR